MKAGVLPNGLHYYILPHHKPENRAFMWLAVNAGSVLEDDDQRGLAHLDEHMAFNGTARFPKQDIVNYIQDIGMRFGADLNAYTNFDETVYQLEVPTDKPEFVGKGMDILRDWAGDVAYDPKEVEAERGVVLEEWRLGLGANRRIFDKESKVLFAGSRYAERITIGDANTIEHAPKDTVQRFYKDWYRPDLMAVFVVGEIDPAAIEKQITERFGSLKNPDKERARIHGEVPKPGAVRVSIVTDHEATASDVDVYDVVATRPNASAADYRRTMVEGLYSAIMAERFAILRKKADAPFRRAGSRAGRVVREIDGLITSGSAKTGKVEDTLRAMLTEVRRVELHGFTQAELDRAKVNAARGAEEEEITYPTSQGRTRVAELVRHFLTGESVIGPRAEHAMVDKYLPTITLAEVNKVATQFGTKNRSVLISAPDGTALPTQDKVLAILDEVGKSSPTAWADKPPAKTLMDTPPTAGKITKETKNDKVGTTEWTLSNGARVIVKPTDFEKDSVVLQAWSPGGEALAKDKEWPSDRFAVELADVGGIGQFDTDDLRKVLTGKQATATVNIGETGESIGGAASVKDVETMFQLVYLRATAPRRDDEAIGVWRDSQVESLRNQQNSPEFKFAREASKFIYKNNPRRIALEPKDVENIDVDKAFAFYKDRFGDVSDFTFVIVGAVDLDKLKPLVETYLASLPGKGRKEAEKDLGIRKISGAQKKEWKFGEAPKASVRLDFHNDETWSRDKERDMTILGQVLSIRLRENLREDKSGVYGVGAGGGISRAPHQERSFTVRFGCKPDRVDELADAVLKEIDDLEKNGIKQDYLDKVKATFLRQRETELKTNRFWVGWLLSAAKYGDDPALILETEPVVARMKSDLVVAAAKKYLNRKELLEVVLKPEK